MSDALVYDFLIFVTGMFFGVLVFLIIGLLTADDDHDFWEQ